ncbi:MAG TPA: hypothetical protein VMG12_11870 [Polyangiaceae bacterium]|nr:hypothetical protein [Polyangiaceae bacterium]
MLSRGRSRGASSDTATRSGIARGEEAFAKLREGVAWAVHRGLSHAPEEATTHFDACWQDCFETHYQCKPGEPAPPDGLCSGAHRDPRGWLACVKWSHAEPSASFVNFGVRAPVPLGCAAIGASVVGAPWHHFEYGEVQWVNRLCRIDGYLVQISQHMLLREDELSHTDVSIFTERYLQFDEFVARGHAMATREAHLLSSD